MEGASLYGSFRAGVTFGDGNTSVGDFGSRWGITGSHEVSEGLTASYKYETHLNTTNAESSGGAGHGHDQQLADSGGTFAATENADDSSMNDNKCNVGWPYTISADGEYEAVDATTLTADSPLPNAVTCATVFAKNKNDGGPGGRLSQISLSGGFGTVTIGHIWAASGNHYGAAIYPAAASYEGSYGGSSGRQGNTVSYSSSAGDVSFQIDKVTGDKEKIDFGASANLGPVGVGFGYWSNANDDASFTGVAISAGAAGVDLTIGLGSEKDVMGVSSDTNNITVGGTLGDTGVSYGVQVLNADDDAEDKNFLFLKNSLGTGASLIFEHVDPSVGDSTTMLGLRVDF